MNSIHNSVPQGSHHSSLTQDKLLWTWRRSLIEKLLHSRYLTQVVHNLQDGGSIPIFGWGKLSPRSFSHLGKVSLISSQAKIWTLVYLSWSLSAFDFALLSSRVNPIKQAAALAMQALENSQKGSRHGFCVARLGRISQLLLWWVFNSCWSTCFTGIYFMMLRL